MVGGDQPWNSGVWDDGEWISWSSINQHVYEQELRERFPDADLEVVLLFEEMVELTERYKRITGRYLPLFGELGELYAEITFGLKRHKPRAQGSDGRIGNCHVEVKTISPESKSQTVAVKRSGNFGKLLLVRISDDFEFEARLLERNDLPEGSGPIARVKWKRKKSN